MTLGRRPARRVDAERNRARVLTAARELIRHRGLASVTMDAIAAAAGVGKGSVFRAFGDKAGLARALVDDDERAMQEAILTGRPPLGPGTNVCPVARVRAFVGAYSDFLERNVELLLVADAGSTRYHTGAYEAWALHLRTLLVQTRTPKEAAGAVHAVLALLAPDLYHHLRTDAGFSARRCRAAAVDAAARIAAPPGDR